MDVEEKLNIYFWYFNRFLPNFEACSFQNVNLYKSFHKLFLKFRQSRGPNLLILFRVFGLLSKKVLHCHKKVSYLFQKFIACSINSKQIRCANWHISFNWETFLFQTTIKFATTKNKYLLLNISINIYQILNHLIFH